jgi:L-arabinokinase
MRTIVCYVSGHGFGHAVRVIEVLRALRREVPDVRIVVRTPLSRAFFDHNLGGAFEVGACRLDVGVVQSDSLTVDMEASLREYAEIVTRKANLIEKELQALASVRPSLVFADIPGLAFDVAARLGVPCVGMTNFSWDWIYADYVRDYPAHQHVVDDLRASYGMATVLLRLPMHGGLDAFPVTRDIPLVARKATLEPIEVRRRLALPMEARIVLLSFGGIGVEIPRVPAIDGVIFVNVRNGDARRAGGARVELTDTEMAASNVRYEDLVGACDAVMSKPGYGIVAECIANRTPLVYTSRGRFAEYPCLVDGIEKHLPHAFLTNDDLHAGRWAEALDRVLHRPRRVPSIAIDGAHVAARALVAIAAGQTD